MRVYINYFKLRIITFLQYRVAALAGISTQLFWAFMLIFIYTALYENSNISAMSLKEIISYVWLQQAFYAFLTVRFNDDEISNAIRSGDVTYEIIRPYNLYFWWYVKNVAKRVSNGLLRFLPLIIVGIIVPGMYGFSLPYSFINFLLFLIALFLGVLVVTGINMIVYTIGFYTYNEAGISGMLNAVMELLCGAYIPVALLPLFIRKGTYYLPFRLVSDLAYRIYSNNITISEGLLGIGLQVIWIFLLIFIGNMIIKKSLGKVFIQGG